MNKFGNLFLAVAHEQTPLQEYSILRDAISEVVVDDADDDNVFVLISSIIFYYRYVN